MRRQLFALCASTLGVTMFATTAFAQETVVVQPQPAPQPTVVVQADPSPDKVVVVPSPQAVAVESESTTVVNTPVIASGIITFGVSYGIAAFAASQSDRDSDKRMYVPLLGPWLAIADRDECPVDDANCDDETTDKVLMVVDGVFQAVGAVTVVYGLLTPRTVVRSSNTASSKVRVTPMTMGRGSSAGLGLAGTF